MKGRVRRAQVRAAIYTRKSVTEGLDQEFNSLDAQRDACEAYVRSQEHEGWRVLDQRFDDGGFSGATTDRPAFQLLLQDIKAGMIDAVVVYRMDRLSRRLLDVAKLIEFFEEYDVALVSVTERIDTATILGRLSLNMLMSFAEYERELIGERIRDKKRATRQRGFWTGGRPILGYDLEDKRLVVNADEAEQVRETFKLYLESGSLSRTVAELNRRGWRNKSIVTARGNPIGGRPFTKQTLSALLLNPILRGLQRCGNDLVPGAHEAIVEAELWDAVQDQLQGNRNTGGSKSRNKTGALLRGLVRCGRCGSRMLHTFSTRAERRYAYYVCSRAHNEGATTCPGTRVSAGKFEGFVVEQIQRMGVDEELLAKTASAAERVATEHQRRIADERRRIARQLEHLDDERDADRVQTLRDRDAELTHDEAALGDGTVDPDHLRAALHGFLPIWDELFTAERERILQLLIERITYDPDTKDVEIALRPCGIDALVDEAGATR